MFNVSISIKIEISDLDNKIGMNVTIDSGEWNISLSKWWNNWIGETQSELIMIRKNLRIEKLFIYFSGIILS